MEPDYQAFDDNPQLSEEVNDIITASPSWILRRGISVYALVIILIIILSAFISYPDVIKAQLKISTVSVPKSVVAKNSGRLVKILVKENESVKKGQILAYLESTANPNDVLKLIKYIKAMLPKFSNADSVVPDVSFVKEHLNLGELQVSYQTFYESYQKFNSAINDGFYLKSQSFLFKDLKLIEQQADQLKKQKQLLIKDALLTNADYAMHKKLLDSAAETPSEFRQTESKYYSMQSRLLQLNSDIISLNVQYLNKKKEIEASKDEVFLTKQAFFQSMNSLLSQAENWESEYTLRAPGAGQILFMGNIQENESIIANQTIFYLKEGDKQYIGLMDVPQFNMGKVHMNQEVLVKLNGYPFEEYGVIKGRIVSISDLPYNGSTYLSKVSLEVPHSYNSNQKSIVLKNGMLADAEIITKESSLLERFIAKLIKGAK